MPSSTTKFGLVSNVYEYFKFHHGKDIFANVEKEDVQKAFQQYVILFLLLQDF
jgi:hypothetical protein